MDDNLTDTLQNIQLTPEGKKAIKEMEYVIEVERAEILWDQARDTILAILRKGIPDTVTTEEIDEKTGHRLKIERHLTRHALSIVELARLSTDKSYTDNPITKSQVIHHLPILIKHGYIIKYGILKSGKRSTDYYRRSSHLFLFANLPTQKEKQILHWYRRDIKRMNDVFGMEFTESEEKELIGLFFKSDELLQKGREIVVGKARSDIARPQDVELHRSLYRYYTFNNEEWIETNRKIREIIFPDL